MARMTRSGVPKRTPSSRRIFRSHNLEGKKACKKIFWETAGLPAENMDCPLIGIVSRFVDQKGFDLLAQVANDLMKENLRSSRRTGRSRSMKDSSGRSPRASWRKPQRRSVTTTRWLIKSLPGRICSDSVKIRALRPYPAVRTAVWDSSIVRATGRAGRQGSILRPERARYRVELRRVRRTSAAARCSGALKAYKDPKIWRTIADERHGQRFFLEGFGLRVCHTIRGG